MAREEYCDVVSEGDQDEEGQRSRHQPLKEMEIIIKNHAYFITLVIFTAKKCPNYAANMLFMKSFQFDLSLSFNPEHTFASKGCTILSAYDIIFA